MVDRWEEYLAHAGSKEDVLVVLEAAQKKFGYVPEGLMTELSGKLGLSLSEVYGVATFYSFLSTKPQGRHIIRACKSLPCHYRYAEEVFTAIRAATGIGPGETTPDGRYSFHLTNCIGGCDGSPSIMVNDDLYQDVRPADVLRILGMYR